MQLPYCCIAFTALPILIVCPLPSFFHFSKYAYLDLLNIDFQVKKKEKKVKAWSFIQHSCGYLFILADFIHFYCYWSDKLLCIQRSVPALAIMYKYILRRSLLLKNNLTGQGTCGTYSGQQGSILKIEQCLLKMLELIKVDTFKD